MGIQARIPSALAALHNFIIKYNFTKVEGIVEEIDRSAAAYIDCQPLDLLKFGQLAARVPDCAETRCVKRKRDEIAQAMWDDYQRYLSA